MIISKEISIMYYQNKINQKEGMIFMTNLLNQNGLAQLKDFIQGKTATLTVEAFSLFFNLETQKRLKALEPELMAQLQNGLNTVFRQQDGTLTDFYLIDLESYYLSSSHVYRFFTYDAETQEVIICKNLDYTFEEGACFYFSGLIGETLYKGNDSITYEEMYEEVVTPFDTISLQD